MTNVRCSWQVCLWRNKENIWGSASGPSVSVDRGTEAAHTVQNTCIHKEHLPSGSVWSGRPFLVECVSIGKATESAEQSANLNFFFASLKEEKYFLNKVAVRSASSMSRAHFGRGFAFNTA